MDVCPHCNMHATHISFFITSSSTKDKCNVSTFVVDSCLLLFSTSPGFHFLASFSAAYINTATQSSPIEKNGTIVLL